MKEFPKNTKPKNQKTYAFIIPAYNEEATIQSVIEAAKTIKPDAEIYVCDNNSTDKTAEIVQKTQSASLVFCKEKGKGAAIKTLFSSIDVDYYIMIDADQTYDLKNLNTILKKAEDNQNDLTLVIRKQTEKTSYPPLHKLGNLFFNLYTTLLFKKNPKDILSGYRILSKKLTKNFTTPYNGFEIDAMISIFAIQNKLKIGFDECLYYPRPENSQSKLNSWKDGFKILKAISKTFWQSLKKEEKILIFTNIVVLFLLNFYITAYPKTIICFILLQIITLFTFLNPQKTIKENNVNHENLKIKLKTKKIKKDDKKTILEKLKFRKINKKEWQSQIILRKKI